MTDDHSASMLILDLSDLSESSSFLYEDYETDEVVWAKIQGYPWWPAYIEEVEETPEVDPHFKLVFFGDEEHSRLDASKLRKFDEYFMDFFRLARHNLKLRWALTQAEELLSKNNQNIANFVFMREYFDKVKRCRKRRNCSLNSTCKTKYNGTKKMNKLVTKNYGNADNNDINIDKQLENTIFVHNCDKILEMKEMENKITTKPEKRKRGRPRKIVKVSCETKDIETNERNNCNTILKSTIKENPTVQNLNIESDRMLEINERKEMESAFTEPLIASLNEPLHESLPEVEHEPQSLPEPSPEHELEQHLELEPEPLLLSEHLCSQMETIQTEPYKLSSDFTPIPSPSLLTDPSPLIPSICEPQLPSKPQPQPQPEPEPFPRNNISPLPTESTAHHLTIITTLLKKPTQYNQLISYLSSIDITVHNITEILELRVIEAITREHLSRNVHKLVQKMRKVLTEKYFGPKKIKRNKGKVSDKNDKCSHESKVKKIRKLTTKKVADLLHCPTSTLQEKRILAIKIESLLFEKDHTVNYRYYRAVITLLRSLHNEPLNNDNFKEFINGIMDKLKSTELKKKEEIIDQS